MEIIIIIIEEDLWVYRNFQVDSWPDPRVMRTINRRMLSVTLTPPTVDGALVSTAASSGVGTRKERLDIK